MPNTHSNLKIWIVVLSLLSCHVGETELSDASVAHTDSADARARPFVIAGTEDRTDQYPAIVEVDSGSGACSGFLFAADRVATAAHCICDPYLPSPPRPGVVYSRDPTRSCSTTARVTFHDYRTGAAVSAVGMVVVHPQFYQDLDAENGIISTQADVALVVLDTPAEPRFSPIGLASTDPVIATPVVLVGYGISDTRDCVTGRQSTPRVRRYGRSSISDVVEREYLVVDAIDGAVTAPGDSGGALLVRDTTTFLAAGITRSGNCGINAQYTSVARYRNWLATTCPESRPHCLCHDDCPNGARSCAGAGSYRFCGQYDADPCSEWGPPIECLSGQVCMDRLGGRCDIACVGGGTCSIGNPCARGRSVCISDHEYTCVFGEWLPRGTPCPQELACDGAGHCNLPR